MGSGSTAYRIALGQYTALQEHLKAESEITLEHEKKLLEVEQERYELMKAGKLPGMEPAASSDVTQPMYFTTPALEQKAGIDYKKLILPAILAFVFLRKK